MPVFLLHPTFFPSPHHATNLHLLITSSTTNQYSFSLLTPLTYICHHFFSAQPLFLLLLMLLTYICHYFFSAQPLFLLLLMPLTYICHHFFSAQPLFLLLLMPLTYICHHFFSAQPLFFLLLMDDATNLHLPPFLLCPTVVPSPPHATNLHLPPYLLHTLSLSNFHNVHVHHIIILDMKMTSQLHSTLM